MESVVARRARIELLVVLAAIVSVLFGASTAQARPFAIKVPDGFVDIAKMPADQQGFIPASVLSARSGYDIYAVRLEGGRVVGHFMVKVNPGATPVGQIVQDLFVGMPRDPRLAKGRFLAHQLVTVQGVECGMIEREDVLNGAKVHQLMYILPGSGQTAWLKLVAAPEQFAALRGPFEAAVRSVGGLSAPPRPSSSSVRPLLVLGAALFAVAVVGWLLRRRRSAENAG